MLAVDSIVLRSKSRPWINKKAYLTGRPTLNGVQGNEIQLDSIYIR